MGLLLRAAFWLAIVFAFLPWPAGSGLGEMAAAMRTLGGDAAQAALTAAVEGARERALKGCAQDFHACAGDVGALARLAAGAGAPESARERLKESPPPHVVSAQASDPPRPPRRPP
ncbi:hypothetical protein [Methylocella sp.]|uniref:hypothetical protein n=1 Tax=Methylocella sp. TaxID=1978226 RepID=UPI0035B25EED